MPTKPLERLLFTQGGLCFFCKKQLAPADASVEHLVASANGGSNSADNCVACCKALNSLLGHMSLKEKVRVILNQKGDFKCPNGGSATQSIVPTAKSGGQTRDQRIALVVADLRKRGTARPRTLKTLTGTINAFFKKTLSEQEVTGLLSKLKKLGIISLDGTKVTYTLPADEA